jgi:hypothetical protein
MPHLVPLREHLRERLRSKISFQKLRLFLKTTPAPIEQLPVEVLRYIINRIPSTEAAALALSSKTILSAVGSEILRIEGIEDRVELLKHLEVFYPNHLLCYQCGKFHLRRTSEIHEYEGDTECDKKNGRFSFSSHVLDIPFTTVQEVMNRHRYGKRHGISMKCLNRYQVWRDNPFDHRAEKTEAKIVDGQLFIRTKIRFLSKHRGRDFKQSCQYCPHQTTSSFKPSEFDYNKTTFIRCLECFTEIRWDRTSCNPIFFGTTRTTVWCNLGHCRSPFETKWRALTHSTDKDNPSRIYISQDDSRYIHLF